MEKSITHYIKLSIHFPRMCWPKGSTQSSIIDSNLIFATPLGCLHSTYLWKVGTVDKESTYQCRRHKRCGFDPWVRKSPLRRKWQPTLVFFPGKFHRQKSLVDGVEKSQTRPKQRSTHACMYAVSCVLMQYSQQARACGIQLSRMFYP